MENIFTTLVSWGVFGILIGAIVHLIDPGDVRGGILGTMFTGIIGALVGGFLANTFLGLTITGFNVQSILIAVAGALILAFLQRLIFRDNGRIRTTTGRMH